MNQKTHMLFRSVILTGFTLLVFKLLVTQDLFNYIAPKMQPFFYFTLIVLFILSYVQFSRKNQKEEDTHCNCNHEHSYTKSFKKSFLVYGLFILPIFSGFLYSDHTLGSEMAKKKGFKYEIASDSNETPDNPENLNNQSETKPKMEEEKEIENTNNTSQENNSQNDQGTNLNGILTPKKLYPERYKKMLQTDRFHLSADNYIGTINILEEEPNTFKGKSIKFNGFIFREDSFNSNQIVVGRMGVSCCVADAGIFGLMVKGSDFSSFPTDSWVEVTGTIIVKKYKGWSLPMVKMKSIKKIKKPTQPYVYENIDFNNLPN
ncbi:TIGR03943 family putative permease subunit [Pontibacillus marinus]|uniref:TIGR03943 family protein n=1 Tax=Pontibacillus marinus BH030004 = DSM 16465 TaxID=1385511 RepID=A0A0A5HLW5_9BACI|nr:TIGR03943 family protein [Pontibacillus marinus]KGX84617.1 hypothetical protein N783_16545 [Pontibacillus marinus BH030004 = DSM 16465]